MDVEGLTDRPHAGWAFAAPPLFALSTIMGAFDFRALRKTPSFLATVATKAGASENVARANDGVVPLFSQWHPYDCRYALALRMPFKT